MAEYAAPPSAEEKLFAFNDFLGLRNNVSVETFAPGDLTTATNIDIDDARNIRRRSGFGSPVVAGVTSNLWSAGSVCLGVGSTALKRIMPDYSTTTLRTGLTAGREMSYAAVGDRVFYANGMENGVVQNGASRTWGLAVPGAPMVAATGGALVAGLYQIALTYIRDDGQESGAGRATTIELTATGGIALSALPVSADPSVAYKAIYATSAGGETLYQVGIVPNQDSTFVIRESRTGASPLLTQFLSPPPVAAEFIAEFRGHLIAAAGSRLYPSEPYAPELFDLRKSLPQLDLITMVAPVTNGVWLGTASQVLWIEGDSPDKWTLREIANYGVIPHALTYADSEVIDGMGRGDRVACFATDQGLCVGSPTGAFMNLTQARYAFPAMDRGAALVRRHSGMVQLLVTLQGTPQAANAV